MKINNFQGGLTDNSAEKEALYVALIRQPTSHFLLQAFTLACEFMYTGKILALEDAEAAMNVWMVGTALKIQGLAAYSLQSIPDLLYRTPLDCFPVVIQQAVAARQLGLESGDSMSIEESHTIIKAALDFLLCDLQVRSSPLSLRASMCLVQQIMASPCLGR